MVERHERGVLDTSVVIDLETLPEAGLPIHSAVAAITLAELASGLHTTRDPSEQGARLLRLQLVEANFDVLAFDVAAARHYGHLVALAIAAGQRPRPRRLDLMIAATAAANGLPIYTRNGRDFQALGAAVTVLTV
jgi:predicted nucleic acid-binding protein